MRRRLGGGWAALKKGREVAEDSTSRTFLAACFSTGCRRRGRGEASAASQAVGAAAMHPAPTNPAPTPCPATPSCSCGPGPAPASWRRQEPLARARQPRARRTRARRTRRRRAPAGWARARRRRRRRAWAGWVRARRRWRRRVGAGPTPPWPPAGEGQVEDGVRRARCGRRQQTRRRQAAHLSTHVCGRAALGHQRLQLGVDVLHGVDLGRGGEETRGCRGQANLNAGTDGRAVAARRLCRTLPLGIASISPRRQ